VPLRATRRCAARGFFALIPALTHYSFCFCALCSHREKTDVFSVNSIAFHHYGTFATAGSDGMYVFWDKDAKQRLKFFQQLNNPITTATFNPQGNIYAYAVGYDYSKGYEYYERMKQPCALLLHAVQEAEIQKKPKGR
jgi:mRNA export factor